MEKLRQLEAENNTLQDRIRNAEDDCKNAKANQQRVQDDNTRLRGVGNLHHS